MSPTRILFILTHLCQTLFATTLQFAPFSFLSTFAWQIKIIFPSRRRRRRLHRNRFSNICGAYNVLRGTLGRMKTAIALRYAMVFHLCAFWWVDSGGGDDNACKRCNIIYNAANVSNYAKYTALLMQTQLWSCERMCWGVVVLPMSFKRILFHFCFVCSFDSHVDAHVPIPISCVRALTENT